VIDSLGDHRIAMAFAIAALRARAPIEITDVANVATSFPGFEDCARQAGLGLTTL
jgi:cyclohexadieny/prephenate dehydrogenase / 3-phosphoshikimate 1-carboxyvinyltransferase